MKAVYELRESDAYGGASSQMFFSNLRAAWEAYRSRWAELDRDENVTDDEECEEHHIQDKKFVKRRSNLVDGFGVLTGISFGRMWETNTENGFDCGVNWCFLEIFKHQVRDV